MTNERSNPPQAWHALQADAALAHLGCEAGVGLSAPCAAQRMAEHGPNALPEAARRPVFLLLLSQFKSPLIYILFVAAALASAMGYWGDAAVILGVVLANALIGTCQEGRAERSMAALRRLSTLQVRVLREGAESTIAARDLVPGDILLLAAGDAVGADARLVQAASLAAAEAALTGESVPVPKHVAPLPEATGLADRRNMVFSGTYITAGRARAVVTATGIHTEVGGIARLTEDAPEPKTPLELRIAQFGRYLVVAALVLFGIVMALGLVRGLPFADVLMVAISQMVSMVPEGLPVAMTIALAVGMQRMAGRGAIIRRLSAVETLGSTTVICSDKTGTLTRNEMTVSVLWLPGGRSVAVSGVGYSPEGALTEAGAAIDPGDTAVHALLQAVALCNDAELVPPHDGATQWTVLGDPTEAALLVAAGKAGIDVGALRRRCTREAELPFDSDTQMMATRHGGLPTPRRVFIKGAPEAVLRLCTADGQAALQAAREAAEGMAARALRVLAVAVVADDALEAQAGFDALAGRATLLGLIGQIDPPREEVKVAVAQCRAAGIRPIMVTGDHKLTGLAIARELGIARAGDHGIDGAELERMNEAELLEGLDRIVVFARVHPAQKLRIVEALQSRGDVVAMTGDGVNDAPALARADVGVAMGITGTEVAKSAARIGCGRTGPGGLRQPEEGDPVPVRHLGRRGAGAAAGAGGWLSVAAGRGADPLDQHRHREHADGEPGDGPARWRRDGSSAGAAQRPVARPRDALAHRPAGAHGRSRDLRLVCLEAERGRTLRDRAHRNVHHAGGVPVVQRAELPVGDAFGVDLSHLQEPMADRRVGPERRVAGAGVVLAAVEHAVSHGADSARRSAAHRGRGERRAVDGGTAQGFHSMAQKPLGLKNGPLRASG